MSNEIRIIGGGEVGRRITERLEHRGDAVVVVERDEERAEVLRAAGHRVHVGDGTDVETLEEAGLAEADVVVVATGDDDSNLLAAQLVRNRFSPESVIARVNKPENEAPFADLGIRTVSRPDATAKMLDTHIESPALTRWMEAVGTQGDIQEVAVENPDLAGSTVGELDAQLPEQVLLLMVGGESDAHLPDREEVVQRGDHVTLLGAREAVREAMADLTGEEARAAGEESQREGRRRQ